MFCFGMEVSQSDCCCVWSGVAQDRGEGHLQLFPEISVLWLRCFGWEAENTVEKRSFLSNVRTGLKKFRRMGDWVCFKLFFSRGPVIIIFQGIFKVCHFFT